MINATLLIAASLTLGQTAEPPAYEHLKELECFIGTWEAETVLPESPSHSESVQEWAGKPLKLRMNTRWATGRHAQITEFVFEVPGEVKITETGITGWDQTKEKFIFSSFTTHKGVWSGTMEKDGDQWVSKYVGFNLDGAKCTGTRLWEVIGHDSIVMKDIDATTGGKPAPDMKYVFKRVVTPAPPSNHDRLKGLSFLVGKWQTKADDGNTTTWKFEWSQNKNALENTMVGKSPTGEELFKNIGMMCWDATSRRIVNKCVTQDGHPVDFIWSPTTEGGWDLWAARGTATWTATIIDGDSWQLDGAGEHTLFRRVKE